MYSLWSKAQANGVHVSCLWLRHQLESLRHQLEEEREDRRRAAHARAALLAEFSEAEGQLQATLDQVSHSRTSIAELDGRKDALSIRSTSRKDAHVLFSLDMYQ
jgi:septal ring factor EnvC (AmiA/AmiB activator)